MRVDVFVGPQNPKFSEPPIETVRYDAAAGETNTVTVTAGTAGETVFADGTAPLTPGPGCAGRWCCTWWWPVWSGTCS